LENQAIDILWSQLIIGIVYLNIDDLFSLMRTNSEHWNRGVAFIQRVTARDGSVSRVLQEAFIGMGAFATMCQAGINKPICVVSIYDINDWCEALSILGKQNSATKTRNRLDKLPSVCVHCGVRLNSDTSRDHFNHTRNYPDCKRAYQQYMLERKQRGRISNKCSECNVTLIDAAQRIKHEATHTIGYTCPLCQYCTYSRDNFKIHLKPCLKRHDVSARGEYPPLQLVSKEDTPKKHRVR
jgi:hypothetical protein